MKPLYWQFYGLLEEDVVKYTAILTPHFLKRMENRAYRINGDMFRELIPQFWSAAINNECCGAEIGAAFVYFSKKYNNKRRRWELEFISITPNIHFHTSSLSHAIKVELKSNDLL